MNKLKIKSRIHDYRVEFIDDTIKVLNLEYQDGDILVVDNKIIELYPQIKSNFNSKKSIYRINAIEENKSYEGLTQIIEKLIQSGFKKNNRLIGIGGGIIQDITAFTASILYRGVDWIFFPSTLLSQGDSCIGSKTSINFGKYKNQLGGFYPPNKIFIDLNFLETLSVNDIQSGLGEMAHYFAVAGENDFKNFKKDYEIVFQDKKILAKIISQSLKIKKDYIEIDEFDQKERQIFNYGHTFGHAIETLTNYKVPHGIAVSYGMDIANFVSVKRKFLTNGIRLEMRALFEKIWSGYDISNINVDHYISALSKDKKNIGGELRLILCKNYGNIFKVSQKINPEFKGWLNEYFQRELIK